MSTNNLLLIDVWFEDNIINMKNAKNVKINIRTLRYSIPQSYNVINDRRTINSYHNCPGIFPCRAFSNFYKSSYLIRTSWKILPFVIVPIHTIFIKLWTLNDYEYSLTIRLNFFFTFYVQFMMKTCKTVKDFRSAETVLSV